jgi:predicted dehydrogenase
MDGYFRVHGSKGWIEVNPAFIYEGLRLTAHYTGPDGKSVDLDEPNNEKDPLQFQREADHFSDCILNNKTPQSPGEEGLRDMQYIREIYRTAGIQMA